MAKIRSVQALRFLAAFLVLLTHIQLWLGDFSTRYGVHIPKAGFSGRFGVDIFFVISGFIIGWLCLENFGNLGASKRFILDRITRIVPLYWAMNAVNLAMMVWASLRHPVEPRVLNALADDLKLPHIVESLFFIPYFDSRGMHRPIVSQGWTLDYEMMLYGLFACALFLPRTRGVFFLAGSFIAVYLLHYLPGLPVPMQIWSDPIIFEFLMGFGLALLRKRFGLFLPVGGNVFIFIGAIAAMTIISPEDTEGLLLNAAVAVSLCALCVLGPDIRQGLVGDLSLKLGDWSYSLYLTHGVILYFGAIVWKRLFAANYLWAFAVLLAVFSLVLSWATFTYFERRVTVALRKFYHIKSITTEATTTL